MESGTDPTADAEMAALLVDKHQVVYELYLLSCCIQSPDFFITYHEHLTAHKVPGRRKGEEKALVFTNDTYNSMYNHLADFYLMTRNMPVIPFCDWNHMDAMVRSSIANSDAMPAEIHNVALAWNSAIEHNVQTIQGIVIAGMSHYLKQTRSKRIMLSDMNANVTLQDTLLSLETVAVISTMETKSAAQDIMAGVVGEGDKEWALRKCIPGPLASLNHAQGGGLAAKETEGWLAPENAGKTIIATQWGAFYAGIQEPTMLFTTEQGVDELLPRIVSNVCDIDFDLVKNGVSQNMLTAEQWAAIENINKYLRIVDWTDGTYDIATHLAAEIEKIGNEWKIDGELANPTCMIFDWLGGALGELTKYDADRMRFMLQLGADTIVNVTKKYSLRSKFMAQAATDISTNRAKLSARHAAESKGIFRKCAWAFGLSALEENPGANQTGYETKKTWADKQWINPFKVRKSLGGMFAVIRDYKYQRLKDCNTQNKVDHNAIQPG